MNDVLDNEEDKMPYMFKNISKITYKILFRQTSFKT